MPHCAWSHPEEAAQRQHHVPLDLPTGEVSGWLSVKGIHSHKLRGTDWLANSTQPPALPPRIAQREGAGNHKAQLQKQTVSGAEWTLHKGWSHPFPSATRGAAPGKGSLGRARTAPIQRNPVAGSREAAGQGPRLHWCLWEVPQRKLWGYSRHPVWKRWGDKSVQTHQVL